MSLNLICLLLICVSVSNGKNLPEAELYGKPLNEYLVFNNNRHTSEDVIVERNVSDSMLKMERTKNITMTNICVQQSNAETDLFSGDGNDSICIQIQKLFLPIEWKVLQFRIINCNELVISYYDSDSCSTTIGIYVEEFILVFINLMFFPIFVYLLRSDRRGKKRIPHYEKLPVDLGSIQA